MGRALDRPALPAGAIRLSWESVLFCCHRLTRGLPASIPEAGSWVKNQARRGHGSAALGDGVMPSQQIIADTNPDTPQH
jgi:hypothetical protein